MAQGKDGPSKSPSKAAPPMGYIYPLHALERQEVEENEQCGTLFIGGKMFSGDSPFDLKAFSDSDYAGASLDRKSTTKGCQFLGKRMILWKFEGEGSGQPSKPQPPSSTTPPSHKEQVTIVASQPQKTHTPRQAKRGRDTVIPRSSGPHKKVGDEAVYIGEDDRVVRAVTTATSLEAEQSGEDNMVYHDYFTDFVPPTPHDSPFSGGHTPGSDEGDFDDEFRDIDDMVDKDIEYVEGDTVNAGGAVNAATIGVSGASASVTTAGVSISTAEPRTPPTTTTKAFEDEDLTISQTLVKMRSEKAKEKGVIFRNVEESARPTIILSSIVPKEFDNVQARMDADALLATRLKEEEREQFFIDEQARFLAETIAERKRQYTKKIKEQEDSLDMMNGQLAELNNTVKIEQTTISELKECQRDFDDDFRDIDDMVDKYIEYVEGDTVNAGGAVNAATIRVSGASASVPTAGVSISTAEPRTPPTTTTKAFEDKDLTISQTLVKIRSEKAKEKGVVFRNVEESARPTTILSTIVPKELALRLHEEEKAKLERMQRDRSAQEEASNAALTVEFDDVQARMDADALLAARLKEEEREQFFIDEQARFLAETIAERKSFTYNQLKNKSIEEIQKLYERVQKWVNDFVPMDFEVVKDSAKKDDSSQKQAESNKKRPRAKHDEESVKK
nr:ribonuclease H-like domain, reverse transcriptase, RNA-dependent DNA polymerase [Tanacetum cinerariifolium]